MIMNKKTTILLAFILGAASGSAVTWYSVKKKYEEIAQREIDSVKEVFANREKERNKDVVAKNVTEDKKEKPELKEYTSTQNTPYSVHPSSSNLHLMWHLIDYIRI